MRDMGAVTVKIDNINPDETGYIKFGAYYQKFTASADGTVSRVALRLFKRSDVAQDLTAKFWEVGESNKLLSQVRLEGEKIEDYAVTEVPFEDEIEVKAGKVYAVSWRKISEFRVIFMVGCWAKVRLTVDLVKLRLKEGGIWKENTGGGESKTKKCSLCVEITSTDSSVNLIDFDTFGSADVTGSKETDVTYDWTDGNPMVSGKGIKTAGIVTSADDGDAGWRIKIPQSDMGQTVTFASGAFQAAAAVEVYLNDQTTPAYTYDDLNAADQVAQKIYTVYIEPDSSAEIRTVFKGKAAADGYLLIGGITLDKMEDKCGLHKLAAKCGSDCKGLAWRNDQRINKQSVHSNVCQCAGSSGKGRPYQCRCLQRVYAFECCYRSCGGKSYYGKICEF